MFENRHIFNGKINGQTVNDFSLDYTCTDLDSRLDYLLNILDAVKDNSGRNFFEVYFDDYYKVIASSEDKLSEEIKVCKRLEFMADYLLRSTEVRASRKNEDTKYHFFVNKEEFIKRTKYEMSSDSIGSSSETRELAFLLPKSRPAVKKEKIQVITKADLERADNVGQILREYQKFLELVNQSVNDGHIAKRRGSDIKGKVNEDMLRVKDQLLGVFGYILRNPITDSTCPDWDVFDYTDIEQIKLALAINRDLDPNDDLSHIIMDLDMAINDLIKSKKLTERQIHILNLYREGNSFAEIGVITNTTTVNCFKTIKTIAKKIAGYYKEKIGDA